MKAAVRLSHTGPPHMACLINEKKQNLFFSAWLPNLVLTNIMYVHRVYAKMYLNVYKHLFTSALVALHFSLGFNRYGSDIDIFSILYLLQVLE